MLDKKKFYINGKWVTARKTNDLDVINPSTEEVCAVISLGSKEDTNAAVSAAKSAFEAWRDTTKEERINLLGSLTKKKMFQYANKSWKNKIDFKELRKELCA